MDQESLDFAYTAFLIFGGFGAAAYVYMKLWAPDFGSFESEEFKLDYKFADKAPVEDIFLNYKHKSLEHWQLWINAEAPSLREEAFKLLKAYLDKPPSKYGYIAKDVVTSMAKLKDVDCFDYLYNIGIKVRDAWAQSKASSVFYKEILNSLVSLDCKKAKDLLAIEVKEAASSGDSEEIQKNILQSVMTMNSHEDISNTFAKILLENELSIDFKLQGLKMLEENGDKKLSVLVGILNKMVRGEETDFQLFSHCFSLLLEAIGENTIIGRKTVVDCLNDRKLADEAIRILETRILNKALNLDTRLLFMIISKVKWKSYLSLQKSLFQRFECDDFEKAIIEQADSYEKSSLVPASQDQIIQVLKKKEPITVPNYLTVNYSKLESFVVDPSCTGSKVIVSPENSENLYLVEAVASNADKTVVVLDIEALMLSPDTIDTLDYELSKVKNKIIFLKNIKGFIKESIADKNNSRISSIKKNILKHSSRQSCLCVASLESDIDELKKNDRAIFDHVNDGVNEFFPACIVFKVPDDGEKKAILKDVKKSLKPKRDTLSDHFELLLESTKNNSRFQYLSFVLKFIRLSLLSKGKLFELPEYLAMLKKVSSSEAEDVDAMKTMD